MSNNIKTGLDRPQFHDRSATYGDVRYAETPAAVAAIDPKGAVEALQGLADGLDFRSTVAILKNLDEIQRKLERRVAPAYPQDLLENGEVNNYEGLSLDLGYKPDPDKAIGFLKIGGSSKDVMLIAPKRIEATGTVPEHWIVPGGPIGNYPAKGSRLAEKVTMKNDRGQGDGRLEWQNITYPDFDTAMSALEAELKDNDYEILQAEPRLSSELKLGSAATTAISFE